jgi:SAM-dependent methyltransferase
VDDGLARWLTIREPHDWAARDRAVTHRLFDFGSNGGVVRVLDLGTGTGSNLRYLASRLPQRQEWLLVDKSAEVLSRIEERTRAWAASQSLEVASDDAGFVIHGPALECRVRVRRQDLDLPLSERVFAGRNLVTASALLDLVSDAWLRELARRCAAAGATALFTLTYNGRTSFEPCDPDDGLARDLLNQHQLRDKGLGGPATGPNAHQRAVHWFRAAGYTVQETAADWDVTASAMQFQHELIVGLAGAAAEQRPEASAALEAWRARRLEHLAAGRSRVVVGHHDLVAWPRRHP